MASPCYRLQVTGYKLWRDLNILPAAQAVVNKSARSVHRPYSPYSPYGLYGLYRLYRLYGLYWLLGWKIFLSLWIRL